MEWDSLRLLYKFFFPDIYIRCNLFNKYYQLVTEENNIENFLKDKTMNLWCTIWQT
jgi:hypothetical protein